MGVIGTYRSISQDSMAEALKGLVWNMKIEEKWHDVEFTGQLDENDRLVVHVKKSVKAPGGKT